MLMKRGASRIGIYGIGILLAIALIGNSFDVQLPVTGEASRQPKPTQAKLPSGKLADVQMGDEVIISQYYDKKIILAPGQPLPSSLPWYGAGIKLRKKAGVGIDFLAPAKWNTDHKYTLRWLRRGGDAFYFNGPTDQKIENIRYKLLGSWMGWSSASIMPGTCGDISTLVVQLVFQNTNPKADTYGKEYVLKEATREVKGPEC